MGEANVLVREDSEPVLLKLDLGCGPSKKEGFTGVDRLAFDGKVDVVLDLLELRPGVPEWKPLMRPTTNGKEIFQPWPWVDDSVSEVHCSHFYEHLTPYERVHFWNELYRVLKKDAPITLITPSYANERAYGDLSHAWPPVVGFGWYYLSKEWRKGNAPHLPLECDFEASWGGTIAPPWNLRNQETQIFAMTHYREVVLDMTATLKKK